jgi:hypothetical protein
MRAPLALLLLPAAAQLNETESGEPRRCFGGNPDRKYVLDWQAKGHDFFDAWEFETVNPTNGAALYRDKGTSFAQGLIENHADHAIIRTGNRSTNVHRDSVRLMSNKQWKYFLAVAKFNHVPHGSGVWPAFWSLGMDEWPHGGEIDILEYVNGERNKVGFHVGHTHKCQLDYFRVNKHGCGYFPDEYLMFYDCTTDYAKLKLGCGPNRWGSRKTGEALAKEPFVMATEWTEDFIKVFRFPEKEVPADIESDDPKPHQWDDKYVVSWFPFAESEAARKGSCPDPANVLSPQKLIINIELCGQWAGQIWSRGQGAPNNWRHSWCVNHGWVEEHDCCAMFMQNPEMDEYLRQRAFFDIGYMKVFQSRREEVLV